MRTITVELTSSEIVGMIREKLRKEFPNMSVDDIQFTLARVAIDPREMNPRAKLTGARVKLNQLEIGSYQDR